MTESMEKEIILEVCHLKQYFELPNHRTVKAVDDVSFSVSRGEVFGLVGESGCGKSTLARCLAGIYRPTAGEILWEQMPVWGKGIARKQQKKRQREIQMIFQDSAAALNPRMRVEQIIREPLRIHRRNWEQQRSREQLEAALIQVGLSPFLGRKYPGELSGGQRQRVAIARSLMLEPKLVIADEPTAALDCSTQAQMLYLFQQLQREKRFTFVLIAHDLAAVRAFSDRVGVMLKGRLVEVAPAEKFFGNPLHPYTKALLSAIHIPDPIRERNRKLVEYDRAMPLGERMAEHEEGHFVLE